ncbi:MAG: BREX system Lon protease-like protein BrxL [Syntrophales bacterium]|nr:BREX system Lon protease-like protein BrxL [Syntrophales bacterium]
MNDEPLPNSDETPEPLDLTPAKLSTLDRKILEYFPGLVVRKDLTKGLKQNAIVPTYVLEYLLGQHCATDDTAALEAGLESVRKILARHYVYRNQSELVKSTIKEKGNHKIIDKVTVELNDKGGYYEAKFSNLGLTKVPVPDDFVRRHPKLLVGGIWCITDLTYEITEDRKSSPWQIDALKPIQVSRIDFEEFVKARSHFTSDEWLGLLMQTIGFNPEVLSRRAMFLFLLRLIPYCEHNYNLIELGPKGTGKSHIYAEFSPNGILISGSEVTTPKLFVNNSNGRIGLVGYWDCICFDEFAGKDKKVDKGLVDIMKNYMANKSFSRGIEQLSAEASMVFMGNTKKSVPYMLKHSHFFEPLPDEYIDSAFLDRIHAYSPGWESPVISSELFSAGYGFIVDYLAETLKHLRNEDFTGNYKAHMEIASELSTRDETGIEKTFSGLMKLIYPDGNCNEAECEEMLRFAMEERRRVREHILRIDDTFAPHDFIYRRISDGKLLTVLTPEEVQYPAFFRRPSKEASEEEAGTREGAEQTAGTEDHSAPDPAKPTSSGGVSLGAGQVSVPLQGHLTIPENARGWSYRRIFANHLQGARRIIVQDPYIRLFFQVRNLMEFLQMVHELVPEGDEMEVHLVTQSDPGTCEKQEEFLRQIVESFTGSRVSFSWELSHSPNFHARSVETDTGWRISLDRGLDMFQKFESGAFSLEAGVQEARMMRGAEITYLKQ